MKKQMLIITLMAALLILPLSSAMAYEASRGPTEVIYYDEANAYDGYTLFTGLTGGPTYLIDMNGRGVHKWELNDNAAAIGIYGYLLENGNLLRAIVPPGIPGPAAGGAGGRLEEVDWDGNVVWEYTYKDATKSSHHDFQRMPNGNTLILAWEVKTEAEALAAGADGGSDTENGVWPDTLIEVTPAGDIVWKWSFWNHMVQDFDVNGVADGVSTYGDRTDPANYGKLDLNLDSNLGTGLSEDWNHINSFDYNVELDQIVLNSREHGEIYVIDHNTTTEEAAGPAGDFIYRWGNPANYGQGVAPTFNNPGTEQLFGAHDIQWIRPGLQGAGNFLVFENSSYRPQFTLKSYIYEIDPYDGPMADGVYIEQHDAGYAPGGTPPFAFIPQVSNQIVWSYAAGYSNMYSAYISGMQRLPNGNTLMCAGEEGHFLEVTNEKQIVWEYVSPVTPFGNVSIIEDSTPSAVFRCYRYGADFAGLAGKDLTPQSTLTGRIPGDISEGFQFPAAPPQPTGWGTSGLTAAGEGGGGGAGGGTGGGTGGY